MGKEEQGIDPRKTRYAVIPRTLSFLFRGSEVLLIQGNPQKKLWAGLYNAIGGHIERGEDVTSGALREIREETGLEVTRFRLVGTVLVDVEIDLGVCLFVFRGEVKPGDLIPSREGQPAWIAIEHVSELPVVPDLPLLLRRVWLMGDGAPPFSARSFYNREGKLEMIFS